jgi:transposase
MITERVDDIPLILAELQKSKLAELLTEQMPDHGNWKGVDSGTVAVIFLTYVLSCADHRTSHVEDWLSQRIHMMRACIDKPTLKSLDLTDDRLGILLDKYSNDEQWNKFESAHNQRLIQVYDLDLQNNPIRLDAMITQSHREAGGDFQLGYSKQHRADLPQIKTMLASVDPFAVPLCSLTVAGNEADDGLYLPVIEELHKTLSITNQLFVGDSKMGSIDNRAGIHALNHYYLTPLSKVQCSLSQLERYLSAKPKELQILQTQDKDGKPVVKATAFEITESVSSSEASLTWKERRIIVYSPTYGQSQTEKLNKKLLKAQTELDEFLEPKQGRRYPKTYDEAQKGLSEIINNNQVTGLIDIQITEIKTEKQVRAYGLKPAETRIVTKFELSYDINEAELQKKLNLMGWRAYACNAPHEKLSTLDAVQCYRNEYRIEHKFDELLNKVTVLMPVYLSKPNRIKALIRLLLLALKYVSVMEMQVRAKLAETAQVLKELYPGNPGRATNKPTTKMLLKAFEYLTLVIMPLGDQIIVKLTALKPIQLKILDLLKIEHNNYLKLSQIVFLPENLSET